MNKKANAEGGKDFKAIIIKIDEFVCFVSVRRQAAERWKREARKADYKVV